MTTLMMYPPLYPYLDDVPPGDVLDGAGSARVARPLAHLGDIHPLLAALHLLRQQVHPAVVPRVARRRARVVVAEHLHELAARRVLTEGLVEL
eukprot:1188688-Prorocentrum_minimum.AAC.2